MHLSDLGAIAQMLALIFAAYALVGSVLGAVRVSPALVASARRAVLVTCGFLLVAAAVLIASFLTHDFGMAYVTEHSSMAMPWYYTVAAFYGGQEGSLLYWALVLSIFSSIAVLLHRRTPGRLMPWAITVLMIIEGFFLFVLNFVATPFSRIKIPPVDGQGLNPVLQDPGMLLHPPMLLMGYMSFSLPFAFAVAAMITGQLDASWLRVVRRWALVAWCCQTTGLLLGAWWSYHVLGWGGYWGWDPVENAALLPWLTATAYLHSAMVQERRGSLKVWNLGLIIATFGLSIFGTFEVRSGIISSVHSFAYSSIGPYFFGFLTVMVVAAFALFLYRLPRLKPEREVDSLISREGSFLINNLLLTGVAFATFWGTIFPILSQVTRGQQMTVGPAFYEQVNGPLFALLIFMMGVGPLLAWRRAALPSLWRNFRYPALVAAVFAVLLPIVGVRNLGANIGFTICVFAGVTILYEVWRGVQVRHGHGENYATAFTRLVTRHRQRYGGYLVHLGLVVLAIGVTGSHFFQTTRDADLSKGQQLHVQGYTLTYTGTTDTMTSGGIEVLLAHFMLHTGSGPDIALAPGQRIFPGFASQPTSIVSITTHGVNDLYVFLGGLDGKGGAAIRVFVNPLVPLVWFGGVMMLLGGIFCWWPTRRKPTHLVEQGAERQPVEVMA